MMLDKLSNINYQNLKIIDLAQISCTVTHPGLNNQSLPALAKKVKIIVQANEITCQESLGENKQDLKLVKVLEELLTKLPKQSYPKLNLKFKRSLSLPGKLETAIAYWQNYLLAKSISENLVGGQLQLTYQLNNCPLEFSLQSAWIRDKKGELYPALAFAGEFIYGHKAPGQIQEIVNNWLEDWQIFSQIINQGFLG